jgi:hypothetical protein
MNSYQGGCHCGRVRFRVRTDFSRVAECNCSICKRKGALHQRVAPADFELLSGADALTLYQFGTRTAKHYFCSTCGVFPFGNPRTMPALMVVNVRCLDDFAQLRDGLAIVPFDGRNWEQAAAASRQS